jgi:hypothetical protein
MGGTIDSDGRGEREGEKRQTVVVGRDVCITAEGGELGLGGLPPILSLPPQSKGLVASWKKRHEQIQGQAWGRSRTSETGRTALH